MPTAPPSITALPSAPDPNNRSTFNALAYPWSAALPTFGTEVSAVATNVKANADEAQADAVAAAADRVQTGLDAVATAADRLQTGLDRTSATNSAAAAAASAAVAASAAAFVDTNPVVKGSVDATKQVRFEVDGLSPATTRVLTVPDTDMTLVGTAATQTLTNKTFDQPLINEKHGADVASASTIDLTAATGNLVDVTGTTTITAITLAEGAERVVRFTGALTLTHGASLVLPGSANITTAAGDFAVFRGYAAGVVRCAHYSKASGQPVVPPAKSVSVWASRDNTLAAGSVAYTGFGGTPVSVDIVASMASRETFSVGSDNGTVHMCAGQDHSGTGLQSSLKSVQLHVTPGNYSLAAVASFAPDTVTLSWTKIGTPIETAYLIITARF